MKRLFSILTFLAFFVPVFSADFTEYENSLLKEIFQKRLETRKFNTNAESLAFIKNYHDSILQESIQSKISDEAKITFDNFLVCEEYHFMWEDAPNASATFETLNAQYKKIAEWNAAHSISQSNEWYLLGAYEVMNSIMPKLKLSEVMKIGLEEKKFFDAQIGKNTNNSVLYINAALWYNFAPAIGGGSNSKAKKFFKTAYQKAQSDYEKFFALIYLSQAEFDDGEKEDCQNHLNQADEILLGNTFTGFVRKLNAAGFSYLDYTKNRDKVEKKLY